jgi:indolepyruvate ferredoxin oxidoreductase alpha subunit
MTGHQEHPGTGRTLQGDPAPAIDYETLLRSLGVEHVQTIDPWDLDVTEEAIRAGLGHAGPAVIIAKRRCMLLPEERWTERPAYRVDPDECVMCEECFEVGCPALVKEGDYPHIREWECAGCSLCAQLCIGDAISVAGKV